jgi:hypothetical protein
VQRDPRDLQPKRIMNTLLSLQQIVVVTSVVQVLLRQVVGTATAKRPAVLHVSVDHYHAPVTMTCRVILSVDVQPGRGTMPTGKRACGKREAVGRSLAVTG